MTSFHFGDIVRHPSCPEPLTVERADADGTVLCWRFADGECVRGWFQGRELRKVMGSHYEGEL